MNGSNGSLWQGSVSHPGRTQSDPNTITDLVPYPAMKDSGVPWLGEVPEYWEVRRLRAFVAQINEQTSTKKPDDVYIALEHVEGWTGRVRRPNSDAAFDSQVKRFRRDDILFGKLRPYLAKVARLPFDGVCVGEFLVLRTRNDGMVPEFLENVLRSKPVIDAINGSTFGARMPRADWGFVGNLLLGIPPLREQSAIVRFLDHADRRILSYIRAKQRLIKLLEEQKQAIIHQAVTRGLDPNVRLKPSGVDWLGDVPEHWRVGSLQRFWKVMDCKHLTVPFVEEGIPLASVVEVQSFDLDLARCKRTTEGWYQHLVSGGRKPKRGDLVYCRNVSVGACAYVNTDINFAMGQDVCLITSVVHNNRYLNYLLHSQFMAQQLERLLVGSTFKRINVCNILALTVLVPPRREQNAICRELDDRTAEIAAATVRAENEIALLREFRSRLIADVVTGKLDVRGVEMPALDEFDPVEDLIVDGDVDTEEMSEDEEDADGDAG